MMSGIKMIDFESPEFDGANVLREDARLDAAEAAADSQRHIAAAQAFEAAVLQHAVNTCLSSCLDCLDLLYIPREQQAISDVAVAHDSWRQEAEPEPCSKDSWLRGAIPEAPMLLQHNSSSCSSGQAALLTSSTSANSPKGSLSSTLLSGLGAAARRSSLGSSSAAAEAAVGTSDALVSSMRRTTISRSSGRPTPAIGRSPSVRSSQSIKDGAAAVAAGSSSVRRSSIRPAAQQQHAAAKQPSHNNNDTEDRLRQELQVRRQQEAIAREMKQKAEQARAALIAVQKELKGKDYTYDSSGKLVLLQKVDPEHLPAPPGPQFKVHTPAAAAEADAASKQGSTGKALSSTSRSLAGTGSKGSSSSSCGGKHRGSQAPAIPPSDFKQTASQTQPPVLETLRPAAGVTLRAGAAAKLGPKRDLAGHPTRAQYQQQAKAQNQQATRVVTSAAAAGAVASSSSGGRGVAGTASMCGSSIGFGSAAGAAAASTSGSSSSAPGVGLAGQAAAAASGAAASSSGRASPALASAGDSRGGLSSAGAVSLLSSSAGMLSSTGMLSSAGQRTGSSAGQHQTAAAGVQWRPTSPDVNMVLVSAADWGAVGSNGYSPPTEAPLAVQKPSDKQIKEEFGRTTFLPKIRSPVQTLKPPKSQPASTGSQRAAAAAPAAR